MPTWTTALSVTSTESISVRGYDLTSLIGTVPYPSVLFLLYSGELPDSAAARVIDAVMVASIDHGAGPPSVLAARTAVSGGASLPAAAAAGMLTFGDFHGAAVEDAMKAIATVVTRVGDGGDDVTLASAADDVVATRRAAGRRLSGFGHRQHKGRDPRIDRLFAVARDAGVAGRHLVAARAIEASLARAVGRPVPINIDGGIAAVLGEVGFPSELGNAVFIASRIAGVIAHAEEERRTMPPMRSIDPLDHAYAGPPPRSMEVSQ